MSSAAHEQLLLEHRALMRHCGEAQARCSQDARAQAEELAHLRAQVMRLRAALVLRDTVLAWEREDHAALEARIPGLPRRAALARRVETLAGRIRDLLRERLRWNHAAAIHQTRATRR